MATSTLSKLYTKHKGICHYCLRKTNRKHGSRLQATREHVVPRSHGGQNQLSNYVLACSGCNNRRGNMLFFCGCSHCNRLIRNALDTDKFIKYVFDGIVSFNKVSIKKIGPVWSFKYGYTHKAFESWEQAMEQAKETLERESNDNDIRGTTG